MSIVTVCRNDLQGLQSTADSISWALSDRSIEWIVVDGGSTDGTPDWLELAPGKNTKWVSEPDDGIYDAMNKGVDLAGGRLIWFLNAGDLSVEEAPARLDELNSFYPAMHFFGFVLVFQNGREVMRSPRRTGYLWHALPTSHQAIVYPTMELRRQRYDTRLSIVGDYDLTVRLWRSGVLVVRHPLPLARFKAGGHSQMNAPRLRREVAEVQKSRLGLPRPVRHFSALVHYIAAMRRNAMARS